MPCMCKFPVSDLIGQQWNLPMSGSKVVQGSKTPSKLKCVHEEHSNHMRLLAPQNSLSVFSG